MIMTELLLLKGNSLTLRQAELKIRRGSDDNSEIIFLISQRKRML